MPGPLNSFLVIDSSIVAQGLHCAVILANLGADVTKVERRNYDDVTRLIPLFANGEEQGPF